MRFLISFLVSVLSFGSIIGQEKLTSIENQKGQLQPWSENVRYWEYKGEPVLLLGGSKTDHLFLADDLLEHLNEIKKVGGNFVRNTMSQREGLDLKPYALIKDSIFDLNQWNQDYWNRFENMLKWTNERDIIVQIEVWDRFDYSQQFWEISPWNPRLNINYDYKQVGFDEKYPRHPSQDVQPFFHSIPGMPKYNKKIDAIYEYQEAFVNKMLSYSLHYGNVLYCMNNETMTDSKWGKHWINFIKNKAKEKGVSVNTTDMFDDVHKGKTSIYAPIIFNDGEHYSFADISQVNSRNFDDTHWHELQWLLEQVNKKNPRPSNHTKIYGSGFSSFGSGSQEDGVERFWRNILAGSAGVRFHRPFAGNGFNDRAKASIKAGRLLESQMKLWELKPHMELLSNRLPNEAYLAAKPGEKYAVYFTNSGSVDLDLSKAQGNFTLKWISISEGTFYKKEEKIEGGKIVNIKAPFKGGWVAALTKNN
ncbi:hypothetical protein [Aurantibacter sp.]|uniref:hypothetical protein n=1 Tax=Aurantibacter sp. TaxID=2807103 RepID=UPI0032665AE1